MAVNYKILITTSGTGSRLGELTKDTNKSLVEIGGKKIISYIVDLYPKDIEIIVTLGHYGNKVKNFLINNYPDRKFNFIIVDKYQGESSSLGYSMLQAKNVLNCPFIFHCNDTIIKETPPPPIDFNWDIGSKGFNQELCTSASYSSFNIKNGYVSIMNRKGAKNFDLFHIGLVGIKNYEEFWDVMKNLYKENPNDSSLNDCAVIQIMLKNGIKFKAFKTNSWHDTGNIPSLEFSQKNT